MRHILPILLILFTATLSAQTAGQSSIPKKNSGNGSTLESFTIGNSQIIGRTAAGTLSGFTLGSGLTLTGSTLSASASGGTWGGITGTLSAQTDLQNALNAKAATSSLGTAAFANYGNDELQLLRWAANINTSPSSSVVTTTDLGAVKRVGVLPISLGGTGGGNETSAMDSLTTIGNATMNQFWGYDGTSHGEWRALTLEGINGILGVEQGGTAATSAATARENLGVMSAAVGTWADVTEYGVGDAVWVPYYGLFACVTIHTSSAATEPGIGADWSTVWRRIVNTRELDAGTLVNALPAISGAALTSLSAANLTGTLDIARIANGSVTNAKLANSSITINGSAVSLGGSATISTGLTIGTTTITSGTPGRYLYDNGGVVGERTSAQVLSDIGAQPSGTYAGLTTNTFTGTQTIPRIIGTQATGTLQLGDADAASPVAQTLQVQSVSSGTSNTAGVDWALSGSSSTGTGTAGNLLLKTSSPGKGASSSTVTITIATPGVVSWASHGLAVGQPVVFTTTGALPTGIVSGTTYYVCRSSAFTASAFAISSTAALADAGTAITTSGSQSGTHTATTSATDQNPPATLITLGPANLVGSQTASPLILNQVWNTSGTQAGVKLNYRDVGSSITCSYFSVNGGSTGTTKIFSVEKVGGANLVTLGKLVSTSNTFSIDNDVLGVALGSARQISWSSTVYCYDTADLILVRDAAQILGVKNGANACTIRVYGNTTGSKYLSLSHDGTNAVISASSGAVTMGTTVALKEYTVATLPSTAATGMVVNAVAVVTDATAPTYLGALTGGGAVRCPVFYNGTAWVAH